MRPTPNFSNNNSTYCPPSTKNHLRKLRKLPRKPCFCITPIQSQIIKTDQLIEAVRV